MNHRNKVKLASFFGKFGELAREVNYMYVYGTDIIEFITVNRI